MYSVNDSFYWHTIPFPYIKQQDNYIILGSIATLIDEGKPKTPLNLGYCWTKQKKILKWKILILCYQYPSLRNKWWCVTDYLQGGWKKNQWSFKNLSSDICKVLLVQMRKSSRGIHQHINKSIYFKKKNKLLTEDKQITPKQNFIKLYSDPILTRATILPESLSEVWL